MPAYLDRRNHRKPQWRYRATLTLPDGTKRRIIGTPATNTRTAAETALAERVRCEAATVEPEGAPRDTDDPREVTVTIRATPTEAATWREAARSAGIPFSTWVRARFNTREKASR